MDPTSLTPQKIVELLDAYIVGQAEAKRAVAVALRNRWRRQRVDPAIRDEIFPKNILMIGPTGVGKTEIARRLAKLVSAPFLKVEASKFTEVGYVGKDVESMIRDLVEMSVKMVTEEHKGRVRQQAETAAEERLLDALLPGVSEPRQKAENRFFVAPAAGGPATVQESPGAADTREKFRQMLREGRLEDREVTIEVAQKTMPLAQIVTPQGVEEMGMDLSEMLGGMLGGGRKKSRTVKVSEARTILIEQESRRMLDSDAVNREALRRAEEGGIVFLDEIDKIASRDRQAHGPDVSREGVQRDILPIIEGSNVTTKYGMVKTDQILFIAAGAFHVSKPSDLIPELQGRFPIRVNLEPLTAEDMLRILKEPRNALTAQYAALLGAEAVEITYTPDGLEEMARIAAQVNGQTENIGARRLHTIMEKVLEEVSFAGPDYPGRKVVVDAAFVRGRLDGILKKQDLSNYIL
ncbi:MAG: ATP-dependent protease ATPase subunit HslU [Deltaproteobacteria bacterium]|nr:ATP-dependent protease ATPase subunit HslU [Deltaproteobacteria bacterium]